MIKTKYVVKPLLAALLSLAVAACATEPEAPTDELTEGTQVSAVNVSAFVLPDLDEAQRAAVVHRYDRFDPDDVIPRGLLEDAILYYDANQSLIPQQQYLIVVDLSKYSGMDRFWMVDIATGAVEAHKVAHGDGSDPDNNGYATLFGNMSGSHMSSLGFYLTAEIYDGTHPHSMRLDGLSVDGSPNGMANTNVRSRLVVVHEASYVDDDRTTQQGRSNGCLALDPSIEADLVDRIHGGTLLYVATSALNSPVGRGTCGDATCGDGESDATCPVDCNACGVIDATGGVVDDGDACFTGGGPARTLRQVTTAGMGGGLIWTHATDAAVEQNFGEWGLHLTEGGRYRVEVFTAAAFAQSRQASYLVHAGGADHAVELDQTAVDGYQTLGEFDFAAGGDQFVHLGDNTGEPGSANVQLVFDAVRLTRIEAVDPGTHPGDEPDPTDPTDPDPGTMTAGCSTSGGSTGGTGVLGLGAVLLVGLRRRRR